MTRTFRLFVSPSAADRVAAARDAVRGCTPGSRILIVGATRGAADDLARDVASAVPATFGIQRFSLTQLAARTALAALAADQRTPSTSLGAEAFTARAVFDAGRDGSLEYFAPVAGTPGFPRALAHTLHELRLAGLGPAVLSPLPLAGPDLARLLERFDAGFADAASVDRADLFRVAARLIHERAHDLVVLLDVPIEHAVEREFIEALIGSAVTALATVPTGDRTAMECLATYFRSHATVA